jgi:hypothetical protein
VAGAAGTGAEEPSSPWPGHQRLGQYLRLRFDSRIAFLPELSVGCLYISGKENVLQQLIENVRIVEQRRARGVETAPEPNGSSLAPAEKRILAMKRLPRRVFCMMYDLLQMPATDPYDWRRFAVNEPHLTAIL